MVYPAYSHFRAYARSVIYNKVSALRHGFALRVISLPLTREVAQRSCDGRRENKFACAQLMLSETSFASSPFRRGHSVFFPGSGWPNSEGELFPLHYGFALRVISLPLTREVAQRSCDGRRENKFACAQLMLSETSFASSPFRRAHSVFSGWQVCNCSIF